jgi:hypothetical protein
VGFHFLGVFLIASTIASWFPSLMTRADSTCQVEYFFRWQDEGAGDLDLLTLVVGANQGRIHCVYLPELPWWAL